MNKVFTIVYNFYVSLLVSNYIFALLRKQKKILKITFMLVSANKKVSSKNEIFLKLSLTKNPAIVIL